MNDDSNHPPAVRTDPEVRTTAEQIRAAAYRNPWTTQEALADDLGISRSYVGDVLAEADHIRAVREAYRSGIDVDDVDPRLVGSLASVLEANADIQADVVGRLRDSENIEDIGRVRIEFEPADDVDAPAPAVAPTRDREFDDTDTVTVDEGTPNEEIEGLLDDIAGDREWEIIERHGDANEAIEYVEVGFYA